MSFYDMHELEDVMGRANQLAHEKGWYDPPKTEFEAMLLMISEITEASEELRDGHRLDEIYLKDGSTKPEGVPIELADAVIRIADFCKEHDIDLVLAITVKMSYNATREHRHGGKAI